MSTIFNNGITVLTWAQGSNPVLDDSLVGIANDYDISIAYDLYASTQKQMSIRTTPTLSVSQEFGYRVAGKELNLLWDWQNKRQRRIAFGNKKGYLTKDYGNKFTTSYKMAQHLINQKTLQWASSDVKQENIELMQDSKDLNLGRMETMTTEMVALLTQGFVETATYGPGSPTPNLESLFSAAHPIIGTWGTFSNILDTPNEELTSVTLQEALDILKVGVKLQNGKFVKQGSKTFYKLMVGTQQAVTAREILNTAGKSAGMFSGRDSNSNEINKFYFEGNLVEICELPNLWDVVEAEYGYGNTLGSQTNWFVSNPFVLDKLMALKKFEDYAPVMKNYEVQDNDNFVVDIRANVAIDHYYAECGFVWSTGAVSV